MCLFFFFKQKTAYEMRISDWSSDVCSSDLPGGGRDLNGASFRNGEIPAFAGMTKFGLRAAPRNSAPHRLYHPNVRLCFRNHRRRRLAHPRARRSEENTSELQSLMRTPYAVFCLKKNKPYTKTTNNTNYNDKSHIHTTY